MKEYLFIQRARHKNGDLELDFLRSATLVLKMNSLAPRLTLKMLNPHNSLLEDFGVGPRDRLDIDMMDASSEDKGETSAFIIVNLRVDENPEVLTLECLEKNAYLLLQKDCRIFNSQSVPDILKALSPKLNPVCGKFPAKNTYHLPNRRRFSLIARLAREHGAVFFLDRGRIVFKTKEELLKGPAVAIYEYGNPDAEFCIDNPRLIDRDYRLEEGRRRYLGWSLKKGLVSASINTKAPALMVGCDTVAKLNNLSKNFSPELSFKSAGNGRLTLGSPLKLIWRSGLPERPLDESYPERVLIGQLVHHEQRGNKGVSFTTGVYGAL